MSKYSHESAVFKAGTELPMLQHYAVFRDNVKFRQDWGIRDIQRVCHKLASDAGWWEGVNTDDINVIPAKLMLMVSEIAEAMEADRKNLPDDKLPHRQGLEVELADAVIRIFDLAEKLDLDIAGAMLEKLIYNKARADHKTENRAKENGKKY